MKRIYPPIYSYFWKDHGEWYLNDLYTFENAEKELNENETEYYFVLFENQIIGIFRIIYHLDPTHCKDKSYVKLHRLYLDPKIQNIRKFSLSFGDFIIRLDLSDYTSKNTTTLLKEIARILNNASKGKDYFIRSTLTSFAFGTGMFTNFVIFKNNRDSNTGNFGNMKVFFH